MENIQEKMRISAYEILVNLIENNEPFGLVMWNNDNWDLPLPEDVMEQFPTTITLNIEGEVLERVEFTEDGKVDLDIMFGDTEYFKEIEMGEIVALVNLKTGQPYIVCDFPQVEKPELIVEEDDGSWKRPTTKDEWIDLECNEVSVDAFIKNNPEILGGKNA